LGQSRPGRVKRKPGMDDVFMESQLGYRTRPTVVGPVRLGNEAGGSGGRTKLS